ncbi:MAG: metallophosphoesterase family protein [Vulcanimicrobiaceae bacterium]
MRVALFSDVHGNVRALDACLEDLAAQGGADLIVGAGDYCMDGPRPREVLERLTQIGAVCVRGNTDRSIGGESPAPSGEGAAEERPCPTCGSGASACSSTFRRRACPKTATRGPLTPFSRSVRAAGR